MTILYACPLQPHFNWLKKIKYGIILTKAYEASFPTL